MTDPTRPAPPTQATAGRRLFHTLLAAVGWGLFLYWWSIVLRHVDPKQVRFTLLFIGITLTLCVVLTAGWAFHNLQVFKRRGARKQVPRTAFEFKRDRLGRPIFFADRLEKIENAQVVQIRLEHEGKTYRAFERLMSRSTSGYTVPVAQPGASSQIHQLKPAVTFPSSSGPDESR